VFAALTCGRQTHRGKRKFDFNWLTATGTGLLPGRNFSPHHLGGNRKLVQIFGHTLYRMRHAIVAMSFLLGLGYVTR